MTFPHLISPATIRLGVANEHRSIIVVMETRVEMERQVIGATAEVKLEPESIDWSIDQ